MCIYLLLNFHFFTYILIHTHTLCTISIYHNPMTKHALLVIVQSKNVLPLENEILLDKTDEFTNSADELGVTFLSIKFIQITKSRFLRSY